MWPNLMKRFFIVILVIIITIPNGYSLSISDSLANDPLKKPKNFYVLGFIPSRAQNIYGIAVGPVGSEIFCDKPYTQTVDGIGIQIIGQGVFQIFYLFLGGHYTFKSYYESKNENATRLALDSLMFLIDTTLKRVLYNGLVLSPFGTYSNQINGASISAWMSIGNYVNGISFNLLWNSITKVNGLSVGCANDALIVNGAQVGLINRTYDIKGIQIGLWNKNRKRSLPIINWNFKE